MALASLRWDQNRDVDETKAGVFIYNGTPDKFHEWEFRTEMRWESTKEEDKKKTMSMIMEALRGTAYETAMDIGKGTLMQAGADTDDRGFKRLVELMRQTVFPFARSEAKQLLKAGHKTKSIMARQPSEPMQSYVNRRRRWWKKLKAMDDSVGLSETVRGDYLLEASGLNNPDQRMILTSTANNRDFEKLAAALVEHFPDLHRSEGKKS